MTTEKEKLKNLEISEFRRNEEEKARKRLNPKYTSAYQQQFAKVINKGKQDIKNAIRPKNRENSKKRKKKKYISLKRNFTKALKWILKIMLKNKKKEKKD